jgi:hypothetical protein
LGFILAGIYGQCCAFPVVKLKASEATYPRYMEHLVNLIMGLYRKGWHQLLKA